MEGGGGARINVVGWRKDEDVYTFESRISAFLKETKSIDSPSGQRCGVS